ncbi:MAG: NADH-ubiquinone oxidoreductase-F iron-sulfur binding region domain-containing protein [Gemmatimonadales bacterium]|nr:NADH-ubiquinone oxidoreductase-F iron-sulfur binding region domain-containing protein [Gemmatimonadales bacterium]
MTRVIYVPGDTTAWSVGADEVADAIVAEIASRGLDARVVRTGSRGLAWLEPLVEVESADGRIGFGPMAADEVADLFADGALPTAAHPRSLGPVEAIPFLRNQTRVTFARAGVIDPLSLTEYQRSGGGVGLANALAMSPQEIVTAVTASGLRGRGGAAFPAGIKWQTVLDAPGARKHIVCNADEGDSGTFADRLLMESDPFQLIEGMVIAGIAVGARHGVVYLRSEYPRTITLFGEALRVAREGGMLGEDILGSGHTFDLTLFVGAGAYICGEETALLESLEGKRGMVRPKPPLPALEGLHGEPTVVNNVLTLAAVTSVLADGAERYAGHGVDRSRGTMPFQLGGNVARGGLVELPFGVPLETVVQEFGGGTWSGRPAKAIQVGGPLGAYLPASQWGTPLAYESFAAIGAMLGHGGIVVFDDRVDMGEQAEFAMAFCAHESCGKCTPCRIGSTRGVEVIQRLRRGEDTARQLEVLHDLCETLEFGSLCALGGLTPMPVRSVLTHFPADLSLPAAEVSR